MAETNPLREERLRKLSRLRERGIDPFPHRFQPSHAIAQIHQRYAERLKPGEDSPACARLAGRITARRPMGGASFWDLHDQSGRLQLYASVDALGPDRYALLTETLDIGDYLGAEGVIFKTKKGELSLRIAQFQVLAKALRPLPEKWHGVQDVETRYRQRYLDLITNEETRQIFRLRSQIVRAMRAHLDRQGFLEVETPILQPLYGGASARPFTTYHNELEQTLYLRISDELYLKRLIIGGFERVYEIGKDFRNEGVSTAHNTEFTQMECYQAYADYEDMMALTEQMISAIAVETLGKAEIIYDQHTIDLRPPWRRLSLTEAIRTETGIDITEKTNLADLHAEIQRRKLRVDPQRTWGRLVDELLKEYVEPKLIQPTFITDYPVEISPLAKKHRQNPALVERFEIFIGALELGNSFSELNDPLDQRQRFLEQEAMRRQGDVEAQALDEDFLMALEYGMPPTGGLGIGIDRLTMLFANHASIRDVILFPALRAKSGKDDGT